MSRYAIIDAGRVVNHIESDAAFASSIGAVPALDSVIGDVWDGKRFSTPEPDQSEVLSQAKERYTAALDAHYLAAAQSKGYDTQYTCALRAGYPGPFQAEGIAFAQWMDACNLHAYVLMSQVMQGQAAMPPMADFIAGLPALTWPA